MILTDEQNTSSTYDNQAALENQERARQGEARLASDIRTLRNRGVIPGRSTPQFFAVMPRDVRQALLGDRSLKSAVSPTASTHHPPARVDAAPHHTKQVPPPIKQELVPSREVVPSTPFLDDVGEGQPLSEIDVRNSDSFDIKLL